MKDFPSSTSRAFDTLCENPLFAWARSRRMRRTLAAAYVANLATFAVVTWFVDSYWVAIPFAVVYVLGTLMLAASTRGIADLPSGSLDERQVVTRNAGYRNTYWAGVTIAFVGGLFVSANSDRDTAFELGLFFAVWGMLTTLPTLLLAWTLPPEIPDDEE